MTDNNHPITPPEELVEQWCHKWTIANGDFGPYLATQAARWGADQELEACCEWIGSEGLAGYTSRELRAARRPKPPSLKEQALAALARLKSGALCADRVTDESIIRRALEQLND
jgi:hypothetical protein